MNISGAEATRDENTVAPANLEVKSCNVGSMYRSLSTLRLRHARSMQIRTAPDFFKTGTIGTHQGVGYAISSIILQT